MAFKASTQSVADAYASILRQAVATKTYMQARRVEFAQATCSANTVLGVIQHFGAVLPLLADWAATPGLAQYARDQVNDQDYDVSAEYTGMRNAMIACRDDLITRFPKDANGWLLYQSIQPSGALTIRTFTAAQLAPTLALVDAVIATID